MFKKFIKSVVGKIVLGYVMIIAVALITTLVSLYIINKNNKSDRITTEILFPSIVKLKSGEKICSDSYMLITRWVNQPDGADKKTLENLMDNEFTKFKSDYLAKVNESNNDTLIQYSKEVILSFEGLIESNKKVLKVLNSQEVFADDSILDIGLKVYESEVKPKTTLLLNQMARLSELQNKIVDEARDEKVKDSEHMVGVYIFSIVLFLIIGLVATRFSRQTIVKPILQLSNLIFHASKGRLIEMNVKRSEDEIGVMIESIDVMIKGMKDKAIFAEKIGQGKYETEFQLMSEEDSMGLSLIKMRDNLKKSAEDDYKRNWATEGLAKFAEILRENNNGDSTALYDKTISDLVKYMGANQGGLFILNEENANDIYIELVACYAYERKRFVEKRIEIGQGILGQTYLEGDYTYISEIPQDYVHITSGLGEVTPSYLLCAPLKVNDKIYGVVEFASFKPFEVYQIDFVNKVGESIASTISNSKINSKTLKLLEISKIQTEDMKSQEEEMRQNVEELQATQEEMERKEREYKSLISELQAELVEYKRN
jgi:hypothetical protein